MKRIGAVAFVVAFGVFVSFLVPASGAEGTFDKSFTWSLSTTYATGTPMVDGYQKFAELLKEYSKGAITLNVFPDSTLYGEADALTAVKSGELEFTGSGIIVLTMYMQEYGFISAPFLLTSYEQFMNLWKSDLLQKAKVTLEKDYNTRNVGGLAYRGFRNTSSNVPVHNVKEFQGVLLRMNTNVVMNDVFNAIGAVCVPISLAELYTSLQNDTVQASEGPWEQMVSNNLFEVQKYIIETRHLADSTCIWMSNKLYESLPPQYKEVVDRASAEAIAFTEKNCMALEEQYKQTMIDKGCQLLECDISGFITNAESAWNKLFKSTWTVTNLEEVRRMAGIK